MFYPVCMCLAAADLRSRHLSPPPSPPHPPRVCGLSIPYCPAQQWGRPLTHALRPPPLKEMLALLLCCSVTHCGSVVSNRVSSCLATYLHGCPSELSGMDSTDSFWPRVRALHRPELRTHTTFTLVCISQSCFHAKRWITVRIKSGHGAAAGSRSIVNQPQAVKYDTEVVPSRKRENYILDGDVFKFLPATF